MSERDHGLGDGTREDDGRQAFLARAGVVVGGSTFALTAAFVGIVSLLNGEAGGIVNRFPFYLLAGAVVFVASLLLLDHEDVTGTTVIVATTVLGVTALVIVGLGVEGLRYAFVKPTEVFGNRLVIYFVAAGLICTGLTYWGLNHWREFTSDTPRVESGRR